MTPNLSYAVATERQHELERQAGCCTSAAEHRRRTTHPGLLGRLTARHRRPGAPAVCCA